MTTQRTLRQLAIAAELTSAVWRSVEQRIPADVTLGALFKDHKEFGARDRRGYAHAVFSWLRWRGVAEAAAPDDREKQCLLAVLLDPATEPAMRDEWMAAGGSVTVPTGFPDDDLMPSWLPDILTCPDERARFIESCAVRPPTWLAIEPERVRAFAALLEQEHISFNSDQRIPGAVAITSRFKLDQLERNWGHALQVQDIASQAVGVVCDAISGERWWDVCAGAGGKTLRLARAVGTSGWVMATDTRPTILENLTRRASAHKLHHLRAQTLDVTTKALAELFDGVLVDAPCSGLGTWPRNPDARWRTTPDDLAGCAERQAIILANASRCVRPGGTLVYSVCTISPGETTAVMESFLSKHPAFQLDPVKHPLDGKMTGGQILIMPQDGPGDGMFIARMRRSSTAG